MKTKYLSPINLLLLTYLLTYYFLIFFAFSMVPNLSDFGATIIFLPTVYYGIIRNIILQYKDHSWIHKSYIVLYSIAPHLVIALPTLRQQKLSLLIPLLQFLQSFVDWFMACFLYCFPYSSRSSNYCDSNSCRSFMLLKALAKSNCNLFAIAFKSEKEPSKKKQRTDNKKDAKRIKSDNFTRNNREKSNIAVAILENE